MIEGRITTAKPFVKWAGGKGQLLAQLQQFLPHEFNNYYEPFVGGGALFFSLPVQGKAFINDINQNLVNAYLYLKKDLGKVLKALEHIESRYLSLDLEKRKLFYYDKRKEYNALDPGLEKTILLIFLNRTCFNGLYRENSKGEFNVPMGDQKNPRICDGTNLRAITERLQDTVITSQSFVDALSGAKSGDFVYFDPPYHPLNPTSSFTAYHQNGFTADDQKKLRDLFKELDNRGCYVMLSNSSADFMKDLYKDFRQETVYAGRNINARGTNRGKIPELVVLNY